MKRIFKFLGLFVISSITLFYATIYIFYLIEYVKGNTYVSYLKEHKIEISENQKFSFDSTFYKHQLFLVGEIHGFAKSPKVDYQLFEHLHKRANVRFYMAEVDYSQAYFLNKYLNTGSDSLLLKALQNFIPYVPKSNIDYLGKWKKLYQYNNTLTEANKIHVLGSDIMVDYELAKQHLNEIIKNSSINKKVYFNQTSKEDLIEYAITLLNDKVSLELIKTELGSSAFDYLHILRTLIQTKDKGRELKIVENFKEIYKHLNLKDQKIYGYYGFAHVLQSPLKNGAESLAYLIKTSELPIGKNMVSMIMAYIDSQIIMPSKILPDFLHTGKTWTELHFSYESLMTYHQYGIKDLKRASQPNSTTIFRLDAQDSPYHNSDRLLSQTMILPFLRDQKIEILPDLATTNYAQYCILLRDSKAAVPAP